MFNEPFSCLHVALWKANWISTVETVLTHLLNPCRFFAVASTEFPCFHEKNISVTLSEIAKVLAFVFHNNSTCQQVCFIVVFSHRRKRNYQENTSVIPAVVDKTSDVILKLASGHIVKQELRARDLKWCKVLSRICQVQQFTSMCSDYLHIKAVETSNKTWVQSGNLFATLRINIMLNSASKKVLLVKRFNKNINTWFKLDVYYCCSAFLMSRSSEWNLYSIYSSYSLRRR